MEPITKQDGSKHLAADHPVSTAIDRAGEELQSAISSVSGAARPAVARLTEDAHGLVNRLSGMADQAQEAVMDGGDQLSRAGQRATNGARSIVSGHPLSAIGLAVAAGFLLSRLVRTR